MLQYDNISCALYVALCIVLLTMISLYFANSRANATLLIKWHITSGFNIMCTVPLRLIYQLFLDDGTFAQSFTLYVVPTI